MLDFITLLGFPIILSTRYLRRKHLHPPQPLSVGLRPRSRPRCCSSCACACSWSTTRARAWCSNRATGPRTGWCWCQDPCDPWCAAPHHPHLTPALWASLNAVHVASRSVRTVACVWDCVWHQSVLSLGFCRPLRWRLVVEVRARSRRKPVVGCCALIVLAAFCSFSFVKGMLTCCVESNRQVNLVPIRYVANNSDGNHCARLLPCVFCDSKCPWSFLDFLLKAWNLAWHSAGMASYPTDRGCVPL